MTIGASMGDALHQRDTRTKSGPLAGVVVSTPEGPGDTLRISLDAYGHRRAFDAFGWAPRGSDDPMPGDLVSVVRADDGELWVIGWHPSTADAA